MYMTHCVAVKCESSHFLQLGKRKCHTSPDVPQVLGTFSTSLDQSSHFPMEWDFKNITVAR